MAAPKELENICSPKTQHDFQRCAVNDMFFWKGYEFMNTKKSSQGEDQGTMEFHSSNIFQEFCDFQDISHNSIELIKL